MESVSGQFLQVLGAFQGCSRVFIGVPGCLRDVSYSIKVESDGLKKFQGVLEGLRRLQGIFRVFQGLRDALGRYVKFLEVLGAFLRV